MIKRVSAIAIVVALCLAACTLMGACSNAQQEASEAQPSSAASESSDSSQPSEQSGDSAASDASEASGAAAASDDSTASDDAATSGNPAASVDSATSGASNASSASDDNAASGASDDSASADASGDNAAADAAQTQPRKIIIDTDTGGDDASAIILAALDPDVEIVGVTVLAGNVELDQATKNALMALEIAGCNAPVYKGASAALDGTTVEAFSVYGADGMGEADLVHPSGEAAEGDAVDFILETVRANPDEIEIVSIGPATNVAEAVQRDPETMRHVKMFWSMGTTGIGQGNATPVAEFNVYKDAPAYDVVLESGMPITIVGLNVCRGKAAWSSDEFQELMDRGGRCEFVAESFTKLREFYASNDEAEEVENCDGLAMMCVLNPDFISESQRCYASCVTDEGEAYAQVIFYEEGFNYDGAENEQPANVTLITEVDATSFFKRFVAAIS